jgi:hypothetical protein
LDRKRIVFLDRKRILWIVYKFFHLNYVLIFFCCFYPKKRPLFYLQNLYPFKPYIKNNKLLPRGGPQAYISPPDPRGSPSLLSASIDQGTSNSGASTSMTSGSADDASWDDNDDDDDDDDDDSSTEISPSDG